MKLRDILWKGRPAAVLPDSWNLKGRGIGRNVATRLVVSRVASWRTRPDPSTSDRLREGRFKRSLSGMTRLTVAFWPKVQDKKHKFTVCYAPRLWNVSWLRTSFALVSESRTRVICLKKFAGKRNEGVTHSRLHWLTDWRTDWRDRRTNGPGTNQQTDRHRK